MADIEKGWVLFSLDKRQFGMPIRDLQQMVVLDDVKSLASAPKNIRGLITLRENVVPVVDTRRCFSMKSRVREDTDLIELMNHRKEDHIRWLEELSSSVEEGREFSLATDPHKCAFGKWYDTFETKNVMLSLHLERFARPHAQIHGVANEVSRLVSQGKDEEAHDLIERTRDRELHKMIELFDEVEDVVRSSDKEVVLVMKSEESWTGFIVDEVLTVRDIDEEAIQQVDNVEITSMSKSSKVADVEGRIHVLLDPKEVLQERGF